jgi:hypothetical protein
MRKKLPASPDDAIVVLDSLYLPIARWHARIRNRPIYELRANSSLASQAKCWQAKTILFLGPRACFTASFVEAANRSLFCRWGIICAKDLAGASFVLAKQIGLLSWSPTRDRMESLDEIGNVARVYTRRAIRERPFHLQVNSALTKDWRTLLLRVHGEGSHANLRSLVLCGRSATQESDLDGNPICGCAELGDGTVCKRVQRVGVRIARFGDLRAATVCLYSCNGFSVAGELYPSDLSCVISAGEGFPAAMLCNDRPGRADSTILDACARALAQGYSLSDWSILENDRQERLDSDRPWLLFGDPSAQPNIPGTTKGGAVCLHVLPLPAVDQRIWSAEPQGAVRNHWIGSRWGTVLLRRPMKHGRVSLVDVSGTFKERYAWLISKRSSAAICRDVEFSLSYLFQQELARSPSFRRHLGSLSSIRNQLDETIRLAQRCYEQVSRTGAWDSRLDILWKLCRNLVDDWDRAFATLLIRYMMNGDLESLLMDGTRVVTARADGHCSRCRHALTQLIGFDLATNEPQRKALRCPVCGPRAAWLEPGTQINARISPSAMKGSICSISISIRGIRNRSDEDRGFLAITFRDKGTGKNFFEKLLEWQNQQLKIDVPIPTNLTPELHTLRIVWVNSLSFAFLRLRCATTSN